MGAFRLPTFLKRHRERRLLRARRRDREDLLLELGALVFELHRQGVRAPELLQAQAAALDVVDQEVRVLEGTLVVGEDAAQEQETDWSETGEWQQPDGGWGETGEWEQTGEWQAGEASAADETGEWQQAEPAPAGQTGEWPAAEQVDWDQTQEWQAPTEDALPTSDATPDEPAPSDEPPERAE